MSFTINQLPNELFADRDLFLQVMEFDNIWGELSESKKTELMSKFLPSELSDAEKLATIEQLFSQKLSRFNVEPMRMAYTNLKLQRMNPELLKWLEEIKSMRHKVNKLTEQKYQCDLLDEVLNQRRLAFTSILNTSSRSLFDSHYSPKQSQNQANHVNHAFHKPKSKAHFNSTFSPTASTATHSFSATSLFKTRSERIQSRYAQELKDIRNKCDTSSSESDDGLTESQDKWTSFLSHDRAASHFNGKRPFTFSEKQYMDMLRKHRRKRKSDEIVNCTKKPNKQLNPIFDTSSITLNDIILRVTNAVENNSSTSSLTPSPPHAVSPILNHTSKSHRLPNSTLTVSKKKPKISSVQKINVSSNESSQTQSSISRFEMDIPEKVEPPIKRELDAKLDDISSKSSNSPMSVSSAIQSTTFPSTFPRPESPLVTAPPPTSTHNTTNNKTASNPTNNNDNTSSTPNALTVKPSASFFSLLRDIFMQNSASNDYRLTLHKLEELVKDKLKTFDSSVCWTSELVAPAMNYLSGVLPPPHLVPLVDYKEKNQQWQWIGSGRDSDEELIPLNEEWAKSREEDPTTSLSSLSQPLPPAKCQTDWIVRPSNEEEKQIYRMQESVRYTNPNRAFTFRVHGYESVVGPVKGCGIGGSNSHNPSSPNKAREHSLLINDRPPFVTLLSLVRDAAARLPNGEGTRADICELLKDSQYLLSTVSDQQVNGIVSGALDRLHYEKDPCVKYDVNRKVWIYLHRNRSEAEFERLHEVQIAAARAKRFMNKASRRSSGNASNNSQSTKSVTPAHATNNVTVTKALPTVSITNCPQTVQTVISSSPNNITNSLPNITQITKVNQVSTKRIVPPNATVKKVQQQTQSITNITNSFPLQIATTSTSTTNTIQIPISSINHLNQITGKMNPIAKRVLTPVGSVKKTQGIQQVVATISNANSDALQMTTVGTPNNITQIPITRVNQIAKVNQVAGKRILGSVTPIAAVKKAGNKQTVHQVSIAGIANCHPSTNVTTSSVQIPISSISQNAKLNQLQSKPLFTFVTPVSTKAHPAIQQAMMVNSDALQVSSSSATLTANTIQIPISAVSGINQLAKVSQIGTKPVLTLVAPVSSVTATNPNQQAISTMTNLVNSDALQSTANAISSVKDSTLIPIGNINAKENQMGKPVLTVVTPTTSSTVLTLPCIKADSKCHKFIFKL